MFSQSASPSVIRTCRMYGVPDALAPVCRNLTKTGIKKLGKAYKDYVVKSSSNCADASNWGGRLCVFCVTTEKNEHSRH